MTRRFAFTVPCLVLLGAAVNCARNPVTGKNELALVSEGQEIQMGGQAAQQVGQSIGYVKDEALQKYVSDIGMRMAAQSERPKLPWAFYVMDDPTVNAFALPGGFIFVTRGILTHMNNEAELVGVLGHEIGHVTARHSVQQMTRQQIAQIGVGVGSILSSDIASTRGSARVSRLFLKYGRDAENQADELGSSTRSTRTMTCARWTTCSRPSAGRASWLAPAGCPRALHPPQPENRGRPRRGSTPSRAI
jgi:predicted Zn-dependent protease